MNEPRDQIESPSGLDLNPSPPPTARVSKKVGLVAIGIVLIVGTLVVYGLYTRKEQQTISRQATEEKHPEPARIAGDQVVREIAPPAVANPPSGLDLNPSPPPTARVSKKVGLVAIGIVLIVGTLVVYGLYTRKEQQTISRQATEEKHPEPARIAGDQVVREIAPPAVANPPSAPAVRPELAQPGDLRPPSITHRRDGPGRASVTRNYASSEGELSPEERLRLAAFREEQQAIASPTAISGNSPTSAGNASSVGSDPLQQYGPLAALLSSIGKQNPTGQDVQLVPSTGQTGSAYEGQNGQSQKD